MSAKLTRKRIAELLEKATPGPWENIHCANADEVWFANGFYDVGPAFVADDFPIAEHNAALIAAAPEIAALALRLAEALARLERAARSPATVAFNLGQGNVGWPAISEDIAACDATRSAARSLLAELEG